MVFNTRQIQFRKLNFLHTLCTGNGYVEFEEYEKFMKKELKKMDYEQKLLLDAFKKFDKDDNGYVSFEELKKALCGKGDRMSDEDVNYFFEEADSNKDGKIDYKGTN